MNSRLQLIDLSSDFRRSRDAFISLSKGFSAEDLNLQAADFTSPGKWHLAHTSWFYETFVLAEFYPDYQVFDAAYETLFNSYYNAVGQPYARPHRSLLSRPGLAEVIDYRHYIDRHILQLLKQKEHPQYDEIIARCRLGIQHEKQHQELFFTDLKFCFAFNPLLPKMFAESNEQCSILPKAACNSWLHFDAAVVELGVDASVEHFSFDNESPRHKQYIAAFSLANQLVTNQAYMDFIADGGYQRAELWLSDGWAKVQASNWQHPLYWQRDSASCAWQYYSLSGLQPLVPEAPVCHISAYEADAFATWSQARLPTEFEWEYAVQKAGDQISQLYDQRWQWTSSAYRPYPGFVIADGALGEYNGKFMCNQWVLRGGSCVTPENHTRPSYRNFFYPEDRWQFTGLRLAK